MADSKPVWPTIMADAKAMPRFDFVVKFVAFHTRTKSGRALVDNMYVRHTSAGWSYGFHGMPALSTSPSPAKLYDVIRRTPLNFYIQAAEETRAFAHTEERQ